MSEVAIMDQYSLVKVIGEGSFGRALLVQPINEEQKYVMKEIRLPKVMKAQNLKEITVYIDHTCKMHEIIPVLIHRLILG